MGAGGDQGCRGFWRDSRPACRMVAGRAEVGAGRAGCLAVAAGSAGGCLWQLATHSSAPQRVPAEHALQKRRHRRWCWPVLVLGRHRRQPPGRPAPHAAAWGAAEQWGVPCVDCLACHLPHQGPAARPVCHCTCPPPATAYITCQHRLSGTTARHAPCCGHPPAGGGRACIDAHAARGQT